MTVSAALQRLVGSLALAGFAMALAAHGAALAGVDVASRFPGVWLLHIGIFVVFIPFVFSSRKTFGGKPSFAQIRAAFPLWIVVLGCTLTAYAVVNFLLFMSGTQGGNPSFVDGKFLLMNHGHLVRELSAQEYASFKANEVRGFSGHWLLFYYVASAYFLARK